MTIERCDGTTAANGYGTIPSAVGHAPENDDVAHCQAAIDAMEAADPDLDPVWGLLVVSAEERESVNTNELVDDNIVNDQIVTSVAAAQRSAADRKLIEVEETPEEKDSSVSMFSTHAPPELGVSKVVAKVEVSPDRFTLPADPNDSSKSVTRWDVQGCDAFVLDGVLSQVECDAIIEQGNGLWTFWDDSEHPRVEFS